MIGARCHLRVAVFLLVMVDAVSASAYSYTQVGVSSNFLVHEDKVFFTQWDHSLTILDLETGTVIARKKDREYGDFRLTESGFLERKQGKVALLDSSTLKVIWQASTYDPNVVGQWIISKDGYGLVMCHELATGRLRWSYNLPGALDVVVEKGNVLVFRSAVFDGPESVPTVILLDLETGKETFRKTAPSGVHYLEAYFDGHKVYVATGKYQGVHIRNTTRFDQGRPSARFEELLVWDRDGNQVETIPVPDDIETRQPNLHEPFTLRERVFARGRLWDSRDAIPPLEPGFGKKIREGESDDGKNVTTVTRFDIAEGSVTITSTGEYRSQFQPECPRDVTVRLESAHGKWTGKLPYLTGPGKIAVVGATAERILLGSNLGHVECIDVASGRSMWIYKFPTLRQTTSFSSGHLPPFLADAAAIYRHENEHPKPVSGIIIEGSAGASKPRVAFDPQPANPFRKLPRYLAIAWSGAFLPCFFAILAAFAGSRKGWDVRLLASSGLFLAIGAVACFSFYGRVSLGSSLALRLAILVPLTLAVFHSVRSIRRKQWVSGTILLLLSLSLTVLALPAFLR